MKKLFFVMMLLIASINGYSQDYVREGNNFTHQVVTFDKETKYTYTVGGKTYNIWVTRNGRAFINRTSKEGKPYKQYLNADISKTICKELGIDYVEKK